MALGSATASGGKVTEYGWGGTLIQSVLDPPATGAGTCSRGEGDPAPSK